MYFSFVWVCICVYARCVSLFLILCVSTCVFVEVCVCVCLCVRAQSSSINWSQLTGPPNSYISPVIPPLTGPSWLVPPTPPAHKLSFFQLTIAYWASIPSSLVYPLRGFHYSVPITFPSKHSFPYLLAPCGWFPGSSSRTTLAGADTSVCPGIAPFLSFSLSPFVV